MTVESATYTSGLNASNPASGDPFIEGDDHIRLLKSTIKATFPNVTGAVTATHTEINAAAAGSFTTLSASGNLNLTGTGNRITGDFSNATVANRVMFQASTVNGETSVHALPNGTSQQAGFKAESTPDAVNCSTAAVDVVGGSYVSFSSFARGSGTNLPMDFISGGSARMWIDTSGNVGIGTTNPAGKFNVAAGRSFFSANSEEYSIGVSFTQARANNGQAYYIGATDSATPTLRFSNASGAVKLQISDRGDVLAMGAGGALGYGAGAGGTVTQATSRNTTVAAINKPTGAITLVSAAGSVTPFTFTVPNSLVVVDDVITLSVRSGANRYIVFVSSIAAGSFDITGYALSGTATEAPIINFAVIKGASA